MLGPGASYQPHLASEAGWEFQADPTEMWGDPRLEERHPRAGTQRMRKRRRAPLFPRRKMDAEIFHPHLAA